MRQRNGIPAGSLFVKIPKLYHPKLTPKKLRKVALGWWALGKRRRHVRYVFAVVNNQVRQAYRVSGPCRRQKAGDHGWPPKSPRVRTRYGWDKGMTSRALMQSSARVSISKLYGRGRNPVRYVGC